VNRTCLANALPNERHAYYRCQLISVRSPFRESIIDQPSQCSAIESDEARHCLDLSRTRYEMTILSGFFILGIREIDRSGSPIIGQFGKSHDAHASRSQSQRKEKKEGKARWRP